MNDGAIHWEKESWQRTKPREEDGESYFGRPEYEATQDLQDVLSSIDIMNV